MIRAALLALALVAAPATAQGMRDIPAQAKAMAEIAFMKGKWLGRSWRQPPQGPRYNYTQTMTIEAKSGGILLAVEGLSLRHGEDAATPGGGSFAVVSFDDRATCYDFRPAVFRWTTAGPVMLRFTVDGSVAGAWRETGERSADGGKSWTPTHALTAWRVDTR